jgi:hypothetical protein
VPFPLKAYLAGRKLRTWELMHALHSCSCMRAPSQLTSAILLNAAELLESRVQNPNPDRIDQLAESLRDKVPPAPQGGSSSGGGGADFREDSSSEPVASHGGNGVHAPTPQQQPPKQQQPQEQEQRQQQQQQPQQQQQQQQERQQSSGEGGGPSLPPRGAMPSLPARPGTKPVAAPGGGGPSLPSRPSGAFPHCVHRESEACRVSGSDRLHRVLLQICHASAALAECWHAADTCATCHALCRPCAAAAAAAGSRGQRRRRNSRS